MRVFALTIAAVASVLAVSGPSSAQEAAAPEGTPANQIELRETHGEWELRCASGSSDCIIVQLAKDYKNNPVAEINILKLPAGEPGEVGVTVLTPLGTVLPAGLVVRIDAGEPRQYPFAWCESEGCFSRFALDSESVDAMKAGKFLSLALRAVGVDEPVVLEVSLSGFTAAMNAIAPLGAE